eukprot:6281309-Alexandrium_andersonii.AAC.1
MASGTAQRRQPARSEPRRQAQGHTGEGSSRAEARAHTAACKHAGSAAAHGRRSATANGGAHPRGQRP